jgi:hypothetical protein
VGEHQRVRLEEYEHQAEAKDFLVDGRCKGNRELLQQAHSLERRNKELNDELIRMYCIVQDSGPGQLSHSAVACQ